MMLLLDPTPLTRGLVGKKVEVVNYPDGRFAVQFNGTALGFRVFDKIWTVRPGAIVENKRLSAVLEHVKAQQAAYPAHQQRGHTARRRWANNLEAPSLPVEGVSATPCCCRGAGLRQRTRSRAERRRLYFRYVTELPRQAGGATCRGKGWVFKDREIYPDGGLAIAKCRREREHDRLPKAFPEVDIDI
jgi:hypothetical protein